MAYIKSEVLCYGKTEIDRQSLHPNTKHDIIINKDIMQCIQSLTYSLFESLMVTGHPAGFTS